MDSLCNVYVLLLAVKQADGCEPRHVRCDRKRKRSFSGLRAAVGEYKGYPKGMVQGDS